ncbi:MAG: hypothetical protein N4A65_11985 [Cohaesibacter sp.]|jgi:hypothetical protein|nr:hypothetical protein [Cohaesibacter sp.]
MTKFSVLIKILAIGLMLAIPSSPASAEAIYSDVCIPANYFVPGKKRAKRTGNWILHKAHLGYKYNELIVYANPFATKAGYYFTPSSSNDPRMEDQKFLAELERRKEISEDVIETEVLRIYTEYMRGVKDSNPNFQELARQNFRQAQRGARRTVDRPVAFYPPVIQDAYHTCDTGRYKLIDRKEYALFPGLPSIRVKDKLCADTPKIIVDVEAGDGRNAHMARFSPLKLVGILQSELMRGKTLGLNFKSRLARVGPGWKFDYYLRTIPALIAHQCGKVPSEYDLIIQQQDVSGLALFKGKLAFRTLIASRVILNEKNIRVEIDEAHDYARNASRQARNILANQGPNLAKEHRRQKRFALGAALFFGAMGGIGITSPCSDPNTSAVMAACQFGDR